MISDALYQVIQSPTTVTSLVAESPTEPPGKIAKQLYGEEKGPGPLPELQEHVGQEDLQRAYECGRWGGTRPSDLFLTVG